MEREEEREKTEGQRERGEKYKHTDSDIAREGEREKERERSAGGEGELSQQGRATVGQKPAPVDESKLLRGPPRHQPNLEKSDGDDGCSSAGNGLPRDVSEWRPRLSGTCPRSRGRTPIAAARCSRLPSSAAQCSAAESRPAAAGGERRRWLGVIQARRGPGEGGRSQIGGRGKGINKEDPHTVGRARICREERTSVAVCPISSWRVECRSRAVEKRTRAEDTVKGTWSI